MDRKQAAIVECMLFVAGEPVLITEIARVLEQDEASVKTLLFEMETAYRDEGRGICLLATDDTAQLVSNRAYIQYVEALLQPEQTRNVSQSILETLAVVAYKQPVTRAEIESVRGVRCGPHAAHTNLDTSPVLQQESSVLSAELTIRLFAFDHHQLQINTLQGIR